MKVIIFIRHIIIWCIKSKIKIQERSVDDDDIKLNKYWYWLLNDDADIYSWLFSLYTFLRYFLFDEIKYFKK